MIARHLGIPARPLVVAALLTTLVMGLASMASGASGATRVNTLLITEIGFGKQPYVAVKNFTKRPTTLGGLYLCQGTRCAKLPRKTVKPGSTVRLATGSGAGLKNVAARRVRVGRLKAADGEIAIYASRARKNPKAMLAYLQWGSAKHVLTPVAVKAGLWRKGAYVASSPKTVRLWRMKSGLWVSK